MAAVSGQLIVFGSYSSTMSPGVCAECVEVLGKSPHLAEVWSIPLSLSCSRLLQQERKIAL